MPCSPVVKIMVSRHRFIMGTARLLALGVGVTVVDLVDPESGLNGKHTSDLEVPLSIELLQNRRAPVPNVMESLMDQGTRHTLFSCISADIFFSRRRYGGIEVAECERCVGTTRADENHWGALFWDPAWSTVAFRGSWVIQLFWS